MNLLVKQRLQENRELQDVTRLNLKSNEEKKIYVERTLTNLRQNNDDRLDELNDQYNDFASQKTDLLNKVKKLADEKDALVIEIADLNMFRKSYEDAIKRIAQWDSEYKRVSKEIKFFETSDNCPTCRQNIDDNFKEDRVRELSLTVKNTEDLARGLESGNDETLRIINDKEKKAQRIQSINAEIKADKQTMMHIVSTMNNIEDNIDKIKNADTLVQDSEEELVKTIKEIERISIALQRQINERLMNDTAAALLKDGGIKTKIIKQYVPIINKLVNKYLDRMGFFVNFNIDENFNEVIKSRYRDEFSYANFSEGEKLRIDLALLLTWRTISKMKNSVNTNLLILDEILDRSLDANGTDEFLKIILNLTDDTNVFIISHKTDQLSDRFDKTYKFEKVRNFSRIV
jgi:DNA repair exonuclease SbcCD ATPase subunit